MVATILHCKLKVSIRALCINIDVAKYSACISIATHVGVRRSTGVLRHQCVACGRFNLLQLYSNIG